MAFLLSAKLLQLLLHVILSAYCLLDVAAATVVVHAVDGEQAKLPCNFPQSAAVDWWYQVKEGSAVQQVCLHGTVAEAFAARFRLVADRPGDHNLFVDSVSVSDSGQYTCIEESGMGPTRLIVQLNVTAGRPTVVYQGQPTTTASPSNGQNSRSGVIIAAVIIVGAFFVAAVASSVVLLVRCRRRTRQRNCKERENGVESRQLMPAPITRLRDSWIAAVKKDTKKASACVVPPWSSMKDWRSKWPDAALTDYIPIHVLGTVLFKCIIPLAVPHMKERPRADVIALTTLGGVTSAWGKIIIIQLQSKKRCLRSQFDRICHPYRLNPCFVQTIGPSNHGIVIGVAHFDNKIYITHESSKNIKVFDDKLPYAKQPEIKTDIKKMSDIVAWRMNESVFVAGLDHHRIRQVTKAGRVGSWPPNKSSAGKGKSSPCSLSAVADKLLVTTTKQKLKVYGLDGTRQHSFDLDKAIDVHYVYATPSEFITYCVRVSDESVRDKLAKNPSIRRVFMQHFHVSFDGERRGLLCDQDKKVIVLTTPDLVHQRVLLSSEFGGLRHPTKLCYVEQRGELLVGDEKDVKVYRMRQNVANKT